MIPNNRIITPLLLIARQDGSTWIDVTDYLTQVEVDLGSIEDLGTTTGADIGVRTMSFVLKNTIRDRFSPKDRTSAWNLVNDNWNPLIWPYREVVFKVNDGSGWVTLFEGYLGDDISTDGNTVNVSCRDKSKRLQDVYIDKEKTYKGEISAEDLIRQIINDFVESPPTLYCPLPSGITFDEMIVEYVSVWDAIQNVAKQCAWYLGYRWNGDEYVLTFMEPPRGKTTPDFTLTWTDDFYKESLNISDKDIRNALTLSYFDKNQDKRVTLSYEDYPELRNEASKAEYGGFWRVMQIDEADTSLIQTKSQALAFGEACIWDVSEITSTDRVEMPLLPWLDIFSTFAIENPRISSTVDFYAVNTIRHSLKFGEKPKFRTEVIGSGRVIGAKSKWLRMETRPGSPGNPIDPGNLKPIPDAKIEYPPPATPEWNDYKLTTSGLTVTWKKSEFASSYEIRTNLEWGSENGLIFRGYAHNHSFVPMEREMILYIKSLNAKGEYSENYATLNISLDPPQIPDQPIVKSFFTLFKIQPTPLNNPAILGYNIYVTINEQTDKISVLAGGEISYPAESGTTAIIQVSAYDIIGEGAKSEPLEATTTVLDDIVIPDWVKDPIENIEEKIVLDVDEDGNISGIVSVKDGSISNHISILADRFSIATPEGRKQVFAFDTEEHKAYILGDLISEGLIRTPEVQTDVAKALLLQAELAVVDEADILRLRADKITVGGTSSFLFSKPEGSTLWHFDNSLVSNSGIKPLDGSVATLRPNEGRFGGAVAVEEGTTNLFPSEKQGEWHTWEPTYSTHELVTSGQWAGWYKVTAKRAYRGDVDGEIGLVYFWINVDSLDFPAGEGEVTTSIDFYCEKGNVVPVVYGDWSGDMKQVSKYRWRETYYVGPNESCETTIYFRDTKVEEGTIDAVFYYRRVQYELKPFATSFVDGTRPDGILAYPIALKDDYTIACYRKSHTDEDYKHVVKRSDGKVFVDGVEDSEYDVGWIAGRNLLQNTDGSRGTDFWSWSGNASLVEIADGIIKKTNAIGESYPRLYQSSIRQIELELGSEYVLSFESRREPAGTQNVSIADSNNANRTLNVNVHHTEDWSRHIIPFVHKVPLSSNAYLQFWINKHQPDDVATLYLRNIKLEKGNKATDWTPAPEDLGYDGDVLMLSNQTGLIDELMVIPYLATEEEAQSWSSMRVPFYDPLTHIDAGTIPISAGEVEITGKGIKLIENDIVKAALGDLEGLPWGGSLLPAGEHGLYAKDAYLTGRFLVANDDKILAELFKSHHGGRLVLADTQGEPMVSIGGSIITASDKVAGEIIIRRTDTVPTQEVNPLFYVGARAGETPVTMLQLHDPLESKLSLLMNARNGAGSIGVFNEGDTNNGIVIGSSEGIRYWHPSLGMLVGNSIYGSYTGDGKSTKRIDTFCGAWVVLITSRDSPECFLLNYYRAVNLITGVSTTNASTGGNAKYFQVTPDFGNKSGQRYNYIVFG